MVTPWGQSQDEQSYGDGIRFYSTARHGGFHLDAERQAEMPAELRRDASSPYPIGSPNWYEEDCEWAKVALAFPARFKPVQVELAHAIARRHFPGQYAAWRGEEHPAYIKTPDPDYGGAFDGFHVSSDADGGL